VGSFRVSRPTALVLALAVLALLVFAGRRLAATGAAAESPRPATAALEAAPAPAAVLVVHVVGAVRRPGLYRLRDGSRVADAVRRAGGATRRAELAGVNLAAPLADGTQIGVPSRAVAAAAPAPPGGGAGAAPAAKVSLASATLEQLDALPGVGPVTAQKILDYRQEHGAIRSVDDLDAIPGIGPARVEQLRDLVTP
jgi:competence protein ComEA